MGKAMELDLIGFFTNYHGVYRLEGKHLAAVEKKLKKMEEVMVQREILRARGGKESSDFRYSIHAVWRGHEVWKYNMPNGKMLRYAKAKEIIQYIMGITRRSTDWRIWLESSTWTKAI